MSLRRWPTSWHVVVAVGVAVALGVGARVVVPRPHAAAPPGRAGSGVAADPPQDAAYAGSVSCRDCHPRAYTQWTGSHHALAERPMDLTKDLASFYPARTIGQGAHKSEASCTDQRFELSMPGPNGAPQLFRLKRVLGVEPLRQFLIPWTGGRYQVTELAADPGRRDWFDIFGAEDRQPGEWGHWTGRGMTWNSMCAACHNTAVRKNYQPATDTYATAVAERGVGCEACHGPMADHVAWQRRHPQAGKPKDPTLRPLSKDQMLAACAACHSRRTDLTGTFRPGDLYLDHFGLVIPDGTDVFYADGQVHEEDYEYTAFLGSRMYGAGVRCGDCHEPHSGKTRAADNGLCLRCHGPPVAPAPKIDPARHSFHTAGQPGDRCVDCHMPQTVYMQRHGRHDHGFTIPDPLLTEQYGIPNACNRCHTHRQAPWALATVQKWYGAKMERPTRARAQWFAQGRAGEPLALEPLARLAQQDPSGLWRAAALGLLGQWAEPGSIRPLLKVTAQDADPLVRAMTALACEPLAGPRDPEILGVLNQLLADPVRWVRIEAAWATRATLDRGSRAGRDLLAYLRYNQDQPSGALQLGVFEMDRGHPDTALPLLQQAVGWDGGSAPLREALAVALSLGGKKTEAVEQLEAACHLAPRDPECRLKLGLALDEAGRLPEAIAVLREAVKLDPRHVRAWYNLGLAYSAAEQPDAALEALGHAEALDPGAAEFPYARATVLARLGRTAEARAAAQRALTLAPDFTNARQLLDTLSSADHH